MLERSKDQSKYLETFINQVGSSSGNLCINQGVYLHGTETKIKVEYLIPLVVLLSKIDKKLE